MSGLSRVNDGLLDYRHVGVPVLEVAGQIVRRRVQIEEPLQTRLGESEVIPASVVFTEAIALRQARKPYGAHRLSVRAERNERRQKLVALRIPFLLCLARRKLNEGVREVARPSRRSQRCSAAAGQECGASPALKARSGRFQQPCSATPSRTPQFGATPCRVQ